MFGGVEFDAAFEVEDAVVLDGGVGEVVKPEVIVVVIGVIRERTGEVVRRLCKGHWRAFGQG